MRLATALFAAIVAIALLPIGSASADTVIKTAPPENSYPKSITFRVDVTSDKTVTDVTLRFALKNRNLTGIGKPNAFAPTKSFSTTVLVDTNPETNWLPVGNEFSYYWEVKLEDGTMVESKPETFLYLPSGREWQKAGNELMTVYYYGERANTANRFLAAATDTYAKVGQQLLQTRLDHLPIKVILFVNPSELKESQPSKGQTFEASGVVTCGYRPGSADDIVIVSASCSGSSSVETLRHEFGHILNAKAGESPLVKLPSWLDEGLAVYAQENNDFAGAYRAALRRQELLAFERISIPPSDPSQTLLFYGQSYAMVEYLITKKGADKLAQLMKLTKANTRFDVAFKQIYGFDIKGFEAEFRVANGLPPAPGAPTPADQQAQPTARPTQSSQQSTVRTPTAQPPAPPKVVQGKDDGVDMIAVGAIGGAVVLALLAVIAFLFSQILANKRGAPGPPGGGPDAAG